MTPHLPTVDNKIELVVPVTLQTGVRETLVKVVDSVRDSDMPEESKTEMIRYIEGAIRIFTDVYGTPVSTGGGSLKIDALGLVNGVLARLNK